MIIAVIGAGSPSEEVYDMAQQVGAEIARRGATVICGGLGGVMEAVCKGAKSEGGATIGVLPGSDPAAANPWVDIPICTGLGHARNVIIVKTGRAVIAVGGAYGTLSELGHALAEQAPVIGLNTWDLARGGVADPSIIVAGDPTDAVDKAMKAARSREAASSGARPSP